MVRIKRIEIKNIKAIENFVFDANGHNLLVTGKNDAGKSTFATFLFDYLNGDLPNQILRNEEKDGFYKLIMTDGCAFCFSITKENNKEIKEFTFIDPDGCLVEDKSFIKQMVAMYFTKPFALKKYLLETPANRQQMIEALFGNEFIAVSKLEKQYYEERRLASQEFQKDSITLANKPKIYNLPAEVHDPNEILQVLATKKAEYKALQDTEKLKKESINRLQNSAEQIKASARNNTAQIEKLLKEQEALLKSLENTENLIAKEVAEYQYQFEEHMVSDQTVISDLESQLQEARLNADKIAKNKEYQECLANVNHSKELLEIAKNNLELVREEKRNLLKSMNLPSDFSFNEDCELTYKGLSFSESQHSTSAKIIAALQLSLLKSGLLRFVHFERTLIDIDNFNLIKQMSIDNDFQMFVEQPSQDLDKQELQVQIIS